MPPPKTGFWKLPNSVYTQPFSEIVHLCGTPPLPRLILTAVNRHFAYNARQEHVSIFNNARNECFGPNLPRLEDLFKPGAGLFFMSV